jgi:cytoplasmic iron level regulating protein YaaA (DUF328/UPF0246 family)
MQSIPVILLPPSEGKAPGGTRPAWKPAAGVFGPRLQSWRTQIAQALHDIQGGDAALLGLSGSRLELARLTNASLIGAPTLPAWQRYTGVVWDHIDPQSLPPAAMERARTSIAVVSGLLGVVGFDDPIPDYKLKIGSALTLPTVSAERARQKLAAFWQPRLSPILDDWIGERTVIDLLPNEHRRAWKAAPHLHVVRAIFVDAQGRTVGHDAKAAKGLFVRHILTSRSPLRAIETWTHPTYGVAIRDRDF